MQALLKLSRAIDALNENVGKATIWLVLVVTLISALNAFVRYGFNYSSNGFLEIQWYLFGAVFLLGAGYTFLQNAHVRIDVLAGKLSMRTRMIIDIAGIIVFLLPLFLGLAVALDPGIQAMHRHAQPRCHLGYGEAALGHLLDRFDLEFFGVTLVAHGTS